MKLSSFIWLPPDRSHRTVLFTISNTQKSRWLNSRKCFVSFKVLYTRCNSVITLQQSFYLKYQINLPSEWNIRKWNVYVTKRALESFNHWGTPNYFSRQSFKINLSSKSIGYEAVQALKGGGKQKRVQFSCQILKCCYKNNNFMERVVLSNEAIFHLSG